MPFRDLWIHIIFAHSLFYVIHIMNEWHTAYGTNCATWILYSNLAHETSRGTFHFDAFWTGTIYTYHIWDGARMCWTTVYCATLSSAIQMQITRSAKWNTIIFVWIFLFARQTNATPVPLVPLVSFLMPLWWRQHTLHARRQILKCRK